ncbi:PaaI family thioesterase [Lactonifactor longoviformis]|uniref:PaaI family thioesterase n=1 Tax=Lactonifactor longoviformis TaxID=341220 RepID=UPI0036F4160D
MTEQDKSEAFWRDEQEAMEKAMRERIRRIDAEPDTHIYNLMKPGFCACSAREEWLTVRYPVEDWALNHMSSMHGGLIAAAVDTTCGILSANRSKNMVTPTINLTINYLSPAVKGDDMLVTAKMERCGRHLVNVSAKCTGEKSGKTIATALVSFMLGGK